MLLESKGLINVRQEIINNFKNTLAAYTKRDYKLTILPSLFVIEPTAYCNINCKICPNNQIKERGFMSFQTYKKIIRKTLDVCAYSFMFMFLTIVKKVVLSNIIDELIT